MKQLVIDRFIDESAINTQIASRYAPDEWLIVDDDNVIKVIEKCDELISNHLKKLDYWTVDITDPEVADVLNARKIAIPSCVRKYVTKHAAMTGYIHPVYTEYLMWNYEWKRDETDSVLFRLVNKDNPSMSIIINKNDQVHVNKFRFVLIHSKSNGGRITPESYYELRQ